MLRVSEPDTVIAERLSGASPFVARDHFSGAVEAPVAPPEGADPSFVVQASQAAVAPVEPSTSSRATGSRKSAAGASAGEIDLSSALGDLEESEETPPPRPASLGEVFKGMRKDTAQGEGVDQSAQHMKLARTCLEMGMLQEAMASLKTAARSPRQRFEAAAMLGRLYRDHGEINDAIEWFERAAEASSSSADEGHALLYDLGLALEDAGETARALAVFLELQANAGEYRDVANRAERLARVQAGG
jgi:tetratricopeptide (TPR) repeat protein